MKVGPMRYRITIEEYTAIKDEDGFSTKAWNKVAVTWADIEPVSGAESIKAGETMSEVTSKIYIRYREGLTTLMRIVWKNHTYNITSILGTKKDGMLTILAREVLDGKNVV